MSVLVPDLQPGLRNEARPSIRAKSLDISVSAALILFLTLKNLSLTSSLPL